MKASTQIADPDLHIKQYSASSYVQVAESTDTRRQVATLDYNGPSCDAIPHDKFLDLHVITRWNTRIYGSCWSGLYRFTKSNGYFGKQGGMRVMFSWPKVKKGSLKSYKRRQTFGMNSQLDRSGHREVHPRKRP